MPPPGHKHAELSGEIKMYEIFSLSFIFCEFHYIQ